MKDSPDWVNRLTVFPEGLLPKGSRNSRAASGNNPCKKRFGVVDRVGMYKRQEVIRERGLESQPGKVMKPETAYF